MGFLQWYEQWRAQFGPKRWYEVTISYQGRTIERYSVFQATAPSFSVNNKLLYWRLHYTNHKHDADAEGIRDVLQITSSIRLMGPQETPGERADADNRR